MTPSRYFCPITIAAKEIMIESIIYLTFDIAFGSIHYNKSSFNEKTEKGDTEEE